MGGDLWRDLKQEIPGWIGGGSPGGQHDQFRRLRTTRPGGGGLIHVGDISAEKRLNLTNSGGWAAKNGHRAVAATAWRKSGGHPGGDLRSSWKVWAANAEQGFVPIELPDLGSTIRGVSSSRVKW